MDTGDDDHNGPTESRRCFLCRSLGAAAAGALGVDLLAACTLPVRSFRPKAEARGRVRIPLDRFPELKRPGGIVKVLTRQAGPVYLRRDEDERFTALSAVCTHQGCVVQPGGPGFDCPCHGSSFSPSGRNLSGPAPRPLARFPTRSSDGWIVIELTPEREEEREP